MAVRWLDLLDPSRDTLASELPVQLDPHAIELLSERPLDGREIRPFLESHGRYVFGGLVVALPIPEEDRVVLQEVGVVATPETVVTIRKTPPGGRPWEPDRLALETETVAGSLVQRIFNASAESYLELLDVTYSEIDELEDAIDAMTPQQARHRLSELRHSLLHARRTVSATRAAVRLVVDDRLELGEHLLFPREVEFQFVPTYETLMRALEELDVARELLSSVRDYHQSKISEGQNEVGKKLTVVASLLLLPTLIVGFYGQNFPERFEQSYWTLGVSNGLIIVTTILQLAFYKWRRWI